ncbi:MAG: DNA polymerase III subunit alpha [Chloroflexi bacterium]|nr:DNA polymerase III subunit alpha [Chloroflexota bacterium]
MSALSSPEYVELHCHSTFSFLNGTSDPEALVERAAELALPALALTDHHGLYGIVRFAAAAKTRAERGLPSPRAIVGAEVLLEHGERIVLLAQNLAGYRNLCWLIDRAHHSDRLSARSPRGATSARRTASRHEEPWIPLDDLDGCTAGLIALVRPDPPHPSVPSPACEREGQGVRGAPIPLRRSADRNAARPGAVLLEGLAAYRALFGGDRVFVETRRHLVPGEEAANATLRRAAQALGLRCVATNDVAYATKDRAPLHDVVTAIRHRVPLERAAQPDGDRPPLLAPNHERCLKDAAEMARLFRDTPEEIAVTVEIATACTFDLADLRYEFPRPDVIPAGQDPYEVLVGEVWKGAQRYYGRITPKLQDRIIHELGIVKQLDLPGYLLVFKDVVDFCHREQILVSMRGSAPASVLLYCLGLCPIDPLEHGLLFERFASPERGEYPDIDLDIAHEDRERVIQYVYAQYGRGRAAMVCEVNTYRTRSAVRDVAFALGLPQHQIDALAKTVDLYDHRSLEGLLLHDDASSGTPADSVEEGAARAGSRSSEAKPGGVKPGAAGQGGVMPLLVSLARQLLDTPRHLSIHVGGMVISARPLHEVVHTEPARMPGRTIIPWDKDDLALLAEQFNVNLIKMDLLGLGMLAVVSRCFRAIEARGEPRPSLHGFRYDERVFDMLCAGDTIGLFQIESRAQVSFLPKLRPRTLHDVAISVGAIRPGPGATGAGEHIARRRAGKEKVSYPHPDLVPALEQTKGVLLWQEQVMQVATIVAGYGLGEAEQLRRAMTHKRSYDHMHALCEDLVQRMLARGHPLALAEEIRQMVIGFAGYGFPRAHAYPFAHLALVSATLRLHYPAEYYAALLNCQPMGFYAPHTLVWDAHRHGVRILPIDVNASEWECRASASEGEGAPRTALRLGFTLVKGLGAHARAVLERERTNGPYCSLADFARRTGLDRDAIERLAEVGAFLRFDERRAAIWRAGELAGLSGPSYLPGLADELAERADLPAMDAWAATRADYSGLGLSPDRHLIQFYRPRLRVEGVLSAVELEQRRSGLVRVGGIVICRQRPETAKEFMFMTIEDETGLVNVIVQPRVYREQTRILRGEPLLVIEGVLQREDGTTNVLARRAWPFEALEGVGGLGTAARAVPSHDYH